MKVYEIKFLNGEKGQLHQLEDGRFACPICGTPWNYPPYVPNDGTLGEVHEVSTPALGDVCPGCGVEFGVDEGCAPYAPIGFMRRQYARFRARWLERVRWRPEALRQLHDNLEMTEEQVR